MSDTALQAWRRWWDDEGSAMRPLPNEDTEQFARRMTEIAWSNGAFKRLADVDRLRAELAAAKKRIAELEAPIRNPLSRALQMEESLRHPKKEGGGA